MMNVHLGPALCMSGEDIDRDPDQRAAFGKFCRNIATYPVPTDVGRWSGSGCDVVYARRRLFGRPSPLVNALVESGAQTLHDVWTSCAVAANAVEYLRPKLMKVFVAGSSPAADANRIVTPGPNIGRYRAMFVRADAREALTLPATYEELLVRLGRHTRRDMRHLRRQVPARGLQLSLNERPSCGGPERRALGPLARPAAYHPREIDAYDGFLAAQRHCFYANLRHIDGSLLSSAAGFVSGTTAFLLYQLNHRDFPRLSLSLTNRAFLLEQLIQKGVRELVLPGGSSGLLRNACEWRRTGEIVLIERSVPAALIACAISVMRKESSIAIASSARSASDT